MGIRIYRALYMFFQIVLKQFMNVYLRHHTVHSNCTSVKRRPRQAELAATPTCYSCSSVLHVGVFNYYYYVPRRRRSRSRTPGRPHMLTSCKRLNFYKATALLKLEHLLFVAEKVSTSSIYAWIMGNI